MSSTLKILTTIQTYNMTMTNVMIVAVRVASRSRLQTNTARYATDRSRCVAVSRCWGKCQLHSWDRRISLVAQRRTGRKGAKPYRTLRLALFHSWQGPKHFHNVVASYNLYHRHDRYVLSYPNEWIEGGTCCRLLHPWWQHARQNWSP